jgi:hypothetical protein
MSLRIDLSGLNLDELVHRVDEIEPEALAEGMEHIRGVSDERTPVETGRLVGSSAVHVEGDEASLTYDGPYARYQHERLDLHHEHGQAKFEESALADEGETAAGIVGRRILGAL